MASPTANAAAHGAGPNNLTMTSPTNVETRWPPIRARGCAGSALGEPSTVTIDVAKGIATSGKAALAENASMPATATAPPAAPATIASNFVLSYMQRETLQSWSSVANVHLESKYRSRWRVRERPLIRASGGRSGGCGRHRRQKRATAGSL